MQENHRYRGADTEAVELLADFEAAPLPVVLAVTVPPVKGVPDGSVAWSEHETSPEVLRSYALIAKLIEVDWMAAGTGQFTVIDEAGSQLAAPQLSRFRWVEGDQQDAPWTKSVAAWAECANNPSTITDTSENTTLDNFI